MVSPSVCLTVDINRDGVDQQQALASTMEAEKTGRMKPYSDNLRKVLNEMASTVSLDEIVQITSLKKRTLERFFSTVKHTGRLGEPTTGRRGRPSVIDDEMAAVSPFSFSISTSHSFCFISDHSTVHSRHSGTLS